VADITNGANIKHGKQPTQRGKVFNNCIRELTVAARLGGPEPAIIPFCARRGNKVADRPI